MEASIEWKLVFWIFGQTPPSHHWCGRRVMCDECSRWWDVYYKSNDFVNGLNIGGIADAYRPEGV